MRFLGGVYAPFITVVAGLSPDTKPMSTPYRQTLDRQTLAGPRDKSIASHAGFAAGPLEMNVIFTEPAATACALTFALSLVAELGARIRLHAAIPVPVALPLDQPPVSVAFMQEKLSALAAQIECDGFAPAVHLYVCRDRVPALLQVLKPNSLVLLGGRKRWCWWPTDASRLARALRAAGHRVILVDPTKGSSGHKVSERVLVEVSDARHFLYRRGDCVFCLALGFYQSRGASLGGSNGVCHFGHRCRRALRLLDVCLASAGEVLRC